MTTYPGLFGMQPQQSPFDVSGLLPQYGLPNNMGASAAAAPAQSFVWGGSGERLTDADIAQREQQDRQQIAGGMDFSPVQSWTQGAARVAQALVAKLDRKHTDAASAANVAATNQAITSLGQPGGGSEANIAALLADPTLSDGVHDYAKAKLAGLNKAVVPTDLQRNHDYLLSLDPTGAKASTYIDKEIAPPTVAVDGFDAQGNPTKTFMPRSLGGAPMTSASAAPASASVPPADAIARLRTNPHEATQFDEIFGPGASAHYLMGGVAPQAPAPFRP